MQPVPPVPSCRHSRQLGDPLGTPAWDPSTLLTKHWSLQRGWDRPRVRSPSLEGWDGSRGLSEVSCGPLSRAHPAVSVWA